MPQHAAACRSMPQHAAACRSEPKLSWGPLVLGVELLPYCNSDKCLGMTGCGCGGDCCAFFRSERCGCSFSIVLRSIASGTVCWGTPTIWRFCSKRPCRTRASRCGGAAGGPARRLRTRLRDPHDGAMQKCVRTADNLKRRWGDHWKGRDLGGGPRSGSTGGWRGLPKQLGAVTVGYRCH